MFGAMAAVRHRRIVTDRAQRDVDALTRRARALLGEHDLAAALAHLVTEAVGVQDASELINAREAGIPPRVWRRLIRTGELPGSMVGREFRAKRSDVTAYIERQRVQPREVTPPAKLNGQPVSSDLAALLGGGKVRTSLAGRA